MNKFEAWKQGLTLEGEALRLSEQTLCLGCPIRYTAYCNIPNETTKTCYDIFKEWGESDAEQ